MRARIVHHNGAAVLASINHQWFVQDNSAKRLSRYFGRRSDDVPAIFYVDSGIFTRTTLRFSLQLFHGRLPPLAHLSENEAKASFVISLARRRNVREPPVRPVLFPLSSRYFKRPRRQIPAV